MASQSWQCHICLSHFSRREHLRRHSTSAHEDQRPYECHGCKRPFKRSDARRRHERTCKISLSIDDNAENDYRPEKRLCQDRESDNGPDWMHPLFPDMNLDNLVNRPIQTPENDFLSNLPVSIDLDTLDWLYSPSSDSDITLAERLEYLAYFTSARGMATFLDRETLRQKQRTISEYYKTISHAINDNDHLSKTDQLIHHLQFSTPAWTAETHDAATHFFSPANTHRFLTYFWALWYPNCPIVHRPFFDPATASPVLVAVMMIIGACLSPDDEDGRAARRWMDPVEQMTFRQGWFGEGDASGIQDGGKWKERLECIQTAYLVCSLQKREGSVEAQGRVRRYRHAMMVTLAREINLSTATHPRNLPTYASVNWWQCFAAEEELIRTLTYVFLFDAALTIFHNSPPRMVVSELKMDMACPEACFQAESAEECLAELRKWTGSVFWREQLSVASVVRRICQGGLSEQAILKFARMGTLNLFTTVQSLHSLTFHLQNFLLPSPLTPFQTGLENWRRTWNNRHPEDQHIQHHPETLWKQIGFVRYAPEFWQLARILVARMRSKSEDESDDRGCVAGEVGVGDERKREREKGRYDHTDMMDVNELIMEYRRLNLGVCT